MNGNEHVIDYAKRAGLTHVYALADGPVHLDAWQPRGAPLAEFAGHLWLDTENAAFRAYDGSGAYLCHYILLTDEQAEEYRQRPPVAERSEVLCGESFQALREAAADRLEHRGKVLGVDA